MDPSPPEYSGDLLCGSPEYSPCISEGEVLLYASCSTRRSEGPSPTGVYTKVFDSTNVTLFNQGDEPFYDRQGNVQGSVAILKCRERVQKVEALLEGWIETRSLDAGASETAIFKHEATLWDAAELTTQQSSCPDALDFSFTFPSTFHDGKETSPLPPSYSTAFFGMSDLNARCTYQLRIVIARRAKTLKLFTKAQALTLHVNYHPRATTSNGVCAMQNSALADIKLAPQPWSQYSFSGESPFPIQCEFFMPALKVFGIGDIIPFHIQISSRSPSLQHLLHHHQQQQQQQPASSRSPTTTHPLIRIYLKRVATVTYRDKSVSRFQVIGKGDVPPLPVTTDSEPELSLSLSGTVRCTDDIIQVGGFHAANLSVNDYLVVEVAPGNACHPIRCQIPVRFVTDSFHEA
ncbi:unnamed protein product [Mycena citricolor]|uniref:Uncharacterized protein n=1 Tax=Mycena citricolor TaxID=2018698 RepID=A0AAD2HXF4_9AGAR|nr:unnamed protein product [Mycena citricolor]